MIRTAKPAIDSRAPVEPLRFVCITDDAAKLPGPQLKVLIGLLRFCWDGPVCWPSQQTIAELVGFDRPKVCKLIRQLVAGGVISKRYQKDLKTCLYEIAATIVARCNHRRPGNDTAASGRPTDWEGEQ